MERSLSEVEALLRGKSFSNPDFKEKLRKRLANLDSEISEEELSQIAGGVMDEQVPVFESWTKKP